VRHALSNNRRAWYTKRVTGAQRRNMNVDATVAQIEIEIEIEIVYNMYRMRRFTQNTVRAGCCLCALPTMPYMKLTSQG
jgi:hypothetical protein